MQTKNTRTVSYSDFDVLSAVLGSRVTAASPLHSGPFLLESTQIDLGDVVLRFGRNSPLLVQGALLADMVWAVFPLNPKRPILINGRSAGPYMVVTMARAP